MASPEFEQLFLRHIAASYDRQYQLADFLGENYRWQLDVASGQLVLQTKETDYTFPAQILGTEADEPSTWLWSWANEESHLPPFIVESARKLQANGQQHHIPEFTQPEIALSEEVNGHSLSLIASGALAAGFYYRGPHEGGAVFLLIPDQAAFHQLVGNSVGSPFFRIVTIFPRLVADVPISNHREAFRNYLAYYNLRVTEQGDEVTGTHANGEAIKANFDEHNRLTQLNTTLKPQ